MNDLITKLKTMKNATQEQYLEVIKNYSHKEVLKELQEAGISEDDLSSEEFDELLEDKIKQSTSFSKGALVATGAFMFLELLG
jgi:tripartite-type tricarboxylate transporter receptor subunit TctC